MTRSLRLILFFSSISLQFCSGMSDASSESKHSETHSSEKMGTREVAIALFGVGAALLFAFFLYNLWQKKKRNEHYARLMKLFEEDDELRLFEEDDELKLFETDDELLGPRDTSPKVVSEVAATACLLHEVARSNPRVYGSDLDVEISFRPSSGRDEILLH